MSYFYYVYNKNHAITALIVNKLDNKKSNEKKKFVLSLTEILAIIFLIVFIVAGYFYMKSILK